MIHFLAVFSDSPNPTKNLETAERMASSFRGKSLDVHIEQVDGHLTVGHAFSARYQPETGQLIAKSADRVLAGALSLYNRSDLECMVRQTGGYLHSGSLALVLSALSCDQDAGACAINGDFALLHYDFHARKLHIIRDHVGNRPLYYARSGRRFLISTSTRAILASRDIPAQLDEMVLASYVALGAPLGSTGYYKAIACVPPGSQVRISGGRASHPWRYWRPESCRGGQNLSESSVAEAIFQRVQEAVTSRADGSGVTGVRLSGGLDSSVIAALICCAGPDRRVVSVSTVLPQSHQGSEREERRYVEMLAAGHSNLRTLFDDAHAYPVLEGAVDFFEWLAAPCGLHDYFANKSVLDLLRKEDVGVCLNGMGGDQFVSCHAEGYLAETVLNGQFGAFLTELRRLRHYSGMGLAHIMYTNILGALIPEPLADLKRSWFGPSILRDSVLRGDFIRNNSFEDYVRTFGYHRKFDRPKSMRQLHEYWLSNLFDSYLIGAQGALGEMHGVEVRAPLLDPRLIELVIGIPSRFKVSSNEDRYLMRHAFSGILPPAIICRANKGPPVPDFKRRLRQEIPLLRTRFARFDRIDLWHRLVDLSKVEVGFRELEDQGNWQMTSAGTRRLLRPYFLGEFLERHGAAAAS